MRKFQYGDAVIACADLAGRAGAKDFEIGYLHDDVPIEQAGWYAQASYQGARIMVGDQSSPTAAAMALAERLLHGATCRCWKPVALADGVEGCRWQLVGQRWESGCDEPSIRVKGQRGDHAAMKRALAEEDNRRERRAAKKRGGDGYLMVSSTLALVPVSFEAACLFVAEHHRHHAPPVGHKFSIGVGDGDLLVGVAIVGRPVARHLDNGTTLEVTRVATDGTPRWIPHRFH